MKENWLTKFADSHWTGNGELWLDPESNNTEHYECTLKIDTGEIHYTWLYDSEIRKGSFLFNSDEYTTWIDSWHQPSPVKCTNLSNAWGLFTIEHSYEVPSNPNWSWRSKLSQRPDGSLVLQMTNMTPWGEEGRAVRMVFSRKE